MKQNVRDFFTIMVSWQQGHIKGRGGGFSYPPPLNFFWGKVKKMYKEDEKWMGRKVVVHVNIFSRGDIFSRRVEIFSGGWFKGVTCWKPPPPPGNLLLFFENRRGTKNG